MAVDKLAQYELFHLILDAVHPAHPLHLIGGFERLGHALFRCQLLHDEFQLFLTAPVNLGQVLIQIAGHEQVGVKYAAVLFQIALPHTAIFADGLLLRLLNFRF